MDERNRWSHETWSRTFWNELVYRAHFVGRCGDEADVLGWNVRLVWGEGRGGILYLHEHRPGRFPGAPRMRYVFTDFDPNTEALHLIDEIRAHRHTVAA